MPESLWQSKDITTPPFVWVAGFMSGTSIDAVDGALIYTDGQTVKEFGPTVERKYLESEREVLKRAVDEARKWNWDGEPPSATFEEACEVITHTHFEAFKELTSAGDGRVPALAGVHGQTVLHRAANRDRLGQTLQLVDAKALYQNLGVPVVFDFRSMDIANGGQGAPLAPAYHAALFERLKYRNGAVLNLGGVANITFISTAGDLMAFDTGPANGPIDEWIERHDRGSMDEDGKFAQMGKVDQELLEKHLEKTWFKQPPPKSLDRYDFSANMANGLLFEDGVATLTAFSAKSAAKGIELLPESPEVVIVCGGGRHNPSLLSFLRQYVHCEVLTSENVGWRGDSIEAEAFGFLAVRRVYGLPTSWCATTGVKEPVSGGQVYDEGSKLEELNERY